MSPESNVEDPIDLSNSVCYTFYFHLGASDVRYLSNFLATLMNQMHVDGDNFVFETATDPGLPVSSIDVPETPNPRKHRGAPSSEVTSKVRYVFLMVKRQLADLVLIRHRPLGPKLYVSNMPMFHLWILTLAPISRPSRSSSPLPIAPLPLVPPTIVGLMTVVLRNAPVLPDSPLLPIPRL